ncbi:carbohydrate kinase [Rhizobium sp. Root274]|uniref:FGGY-family carbohydrate kinase n=1 Tax=unclassified Rhizobium TaxID=2613769 RepID=UPI000714A0ED|nr:MULTISPECIES: FGGY-family carbohydrate kinase [unclassified Rhizobium]KQW27191.1 carbohydrate kinase [Rhizobium sp. Root1240]KRD26667.1 carbohydrate kinase [Rhizobium sp. Root274]
MKTQPLRRIAVIDIGKTNAKVVLVDALSGREIAVRKCTNTVLPGPPYPHFDIESLWAFIIDTLKEFAGNPGFDALSITTHGASGVLLNKRGELALPVLDYEYLYPQEVQASYEALRPDFAETSSPLLSGGLNWGAQLHFQKELFPEAFASVATILTYPQYWSYRLTGVAANEATSLGCHTDLWLPFEGTYSPLVDRLGIRTLMAPIRSAFDALGVIRPEISAELGLSGAVPVYCGIHDSNASLLPHLIGFGTPCTVVSTGTWVISFAVGAKPAHLDAARDTLVNVDANGNPVPSARFMGGREWDLLTHDLPPTTEDEERAALRSVLDKELMMLPSVVKGTGPYPGHTARWTKEPASPAEHRVAASLYEALMTLTCLDLIASAGPIVVEGPFAGNPVYLAALHTLAERAVHASEASTGTAIGAALLTGIRLEVPMHEVRDTIDGLQAYAETWRCLTHTA